MRTRSITIRRASNATSVLALATVMLCGTTPAAAQSIAGVPIGTPINATVATGPNTTTVTVTAPQAVINWNPTGNLTADGRVFVLPGTTTTFTGTADFAILNNIVSTNDPSVFLGTVNSEVNGATGGSVYFYNGNGLVVGSSGSFNVGSLGLTTVPIPYNSTTGAFVSGFGGTDPNVTFDANSPPPMASGFGGSIETRLGSSITASNYVAMVAPRIVHDGAIVTDGAAALVAAEGAVINFSPDGLFDIQVTSGTTDSNGIVSSGDINGVASSGPGDHNRIYMVAVPKNQALTMALYGGSTLGFAIAGAADKVGNTIVLSAGKDINGGQIVSTRSAGGGTGDAGISMVNVNTTSALVSDATGSNDVYAFGSTTSMIGDVSMHSDNGYASLGAQGGGTMTIDGNAEVSTSRTVAVDAVGSPAGTASLYAYGGTTTVNGNVWITSDATGQSVVSSGTGGIATGGVALLQASQGGALQVNGDAYLSAIGQGGSVVDGSGTAGSGTGGTVQIDTYDSGTQLTVTGLVEAHVNGIGGGNYAGSGGAGQGGNLYLRSTAGTLNITGDTELTSIGTGGYAEGSGAGGLGTGGTIRIEAFSGGMLNFVEGSVEADSSGYGGDSFDTGAAYGNGQGGFVFFNATGGGKLDAASNVSLFANGEAGNGGECSSCGGAAGTGNGGQVSVYANNAGSTLTVDGGLSMTANGYGSLATNSGPGGLGRGGVVRLSADQSGAVNVSSADLSAEGHGGTDYVGTGGGNGTGNLAEVFTSNGGTVSVQSNLTVSADGEGGDSLAESGGGNGGNGTAGNAHVVAYGGSISAGSTSIHGDGYGGFSYGSFGGHGFGSELTYLAAEGGDITIDGDATVSTDGFGGSGFSGGGDGVGGYTEVVNEVGGAQIYAFNGDVVINGSAYVSSDGFGGDATGAGFNGGGGYGGQARVNTYNSNAGPASITVSGVESSISMSAIGVGGNGATGASGIGGVGGAGGEGLGGNVSVLGSAGNGTVTADAVYADVHGVGGDGGDGGDNVSGVGGDGGIGGLARGGGIQIGTASFSAQGGATGGASFGFVYADSGADGGTGGDGGMGGTLRGLGGNGGDAFGGGNTLLVRGTTVTVDYAELNTIVNGGDAGIGSFAGAGGNASIGYLGDNYTYVAGPSITVTNRYLVPAQRGSLQAGTITGTAIATGGIGDTNGTSTHLGVINIGVINSDVNVDSVSFSLSADTVDPAALPDRIFIQNGDFTATSNFSFDTSNSLAVFLDNATLTAPTVSLAAANFVVNPIGTVDTSVGTIAAGTLNVSTGQDIVLTANLEVDGSINFNAPGLIDLYNVTSGNGGVLFHAGGDIDVDDVMAVNEIHLESDNGDIIAGDLDSSDSNIVLYAYRTLTRLGGSISTGTVDASGNVFLLSQDEISTGDVTGGGYVAIETRDDSSGSQVYTSSIVTGNIQSGANTQVLGGTTIATGTIDSGTWVWLRSSTGTSFTSIDAGGDVSFDGGGPVNGGYVTSGGTISAAGKPSIVLGDLDAANAVFLTAALGGIATGNVVAGGDVLMQTPGQLTVGTIDTDGGVTLAATGALAAGDIVAGTNADIQSGISIAAGAVDAGGNIYSRNSGASSFGVLTAGGDINVGSIGALTFTSADAGETVRLGSDDGITGGTVVAGDSIVASTYGLIELGNLSAGIVNPSANSSALYEVALVAGSLDVGTINAAGDVQLAGFDGIIAGDVTTSERMFAVSDGNIALGNISTGGQLLIGGWDMFAFTGVIHVNNTFDARPTFASSQANTLGSITVGTIAGSEVDLYADGNIAFSNVNADDFEFDSGGAVTGGNIVATSHAGGEAEGAIMLGNITVSGPSQIEDFSVGFASNTSIQVGTVSGYDKVGFATLGTLTTGNVTAGSLFIAMVGGNTQTGSITTDPAGEVYLADSSMFATGGGPDDFDASIVLALNPVPTAGSININGPVSTGRFRAATSAGLTVGTLTADAIEATADQLTLGNINSSQAVILSATSGVTTGNIITDSAVDIFSSAGGIATGDILAGTYVLLEAGGNITTGNVAAGLGGPILGLIGPQDIGPGNAIEMFSDASINTGDLSTDGYIGLYAAQNVTTGTLTADHDIVALAGGNASFGAIDTPERFVLAGYSNLDALYYNEGFHPEDLFDNFALAATGGNATFGGSSNVGDSFRAFVGGNTTIQSLAVGGPEFGGYMGVDTGGLLSINGAVSAYYAQLLSGDIALGAQSSLSAYGVLLASRNASGMFIGDNLSGQGGYRIGQAEVDRISTDSLSFYAFTDRGAGSRMTIGDLTYNALQNFDEDPLGFAVVSDSDEAVTGTIRIVGNLAISASVDQEIDFGSTTFEIDAATGSLAIDDGNGGLGGTLQIDARDVFVASGAILDKLEANPRYQGYIAELNAPASVQRPDGVLRTAIIEFNTNETAVLENLLIQNTGTAQLPAGFVISELALSGEEGVDVPPGQINLVINGQVQTEGGTLTGIAVRDLLVSEFGTEAFVPGSTINGCLLTGGCSGSGPGPGSEPGVNITPTQITMINGDTLNNPPFGNEGDIDDGNEGDSGASSPISAPQPLFDTRQLTPEDDFNEPISGAGNPSLYGVSSDEDDEDEDEDDKDKSNEKTNARTGDGQ